MSTPSDSKGSSNWQRVDDACDEFERAKRSGEQPRIEDFLSRTTSPEEHDMLLRELILLDYELCAELGITHFDEEQLYNSLPTRHAFIRSAIEDARQNSPVPISAHNTLTGKQLGKYLMTSRIGAGGMGEVYMAHHLGMDRVVAIKVLRPDLVDSQEAINRFHREIHAVAQLMHPNLVRAFDAGESDGVHYLVLEYVDGCDLSSYVRQNGPLDWRTANSIAIQAAHGLSYAHQRNVVHRDVKPSNLIVARDGVVKVLDLGLARIEAEANDTDDHSLTQVGTIMGTIDYMAPEQSLDTRNADARADIYSLGCTLYFLITGKPMYQGDTVVKRLLAHREKPIPSLRDSFPEIPYSIDDAFQKMVAKRVQDRFQSMKEVADALQECSDDASVILPADGSHDRLHSQAGDTDRGFTEPTIVTPEADHSAASSSSSTVTQNAPSPGLDKIWPLSRSALTGLVVIGMVIAVGLFAWMRPTDRPLPEQASIAPSVLPAGSGKPEDTAPKLPSLPWSSLKPTKMVALRGATLTPQDDQSILVSGAQRLNEVYQIAVTPEVDTVHAIRLEVFPFDAPGGKRIGRNASGNAHLTKFKLFEPVSADEYREVKSLSAAWCDYQYTDPLTVGVTGTIDDDNPLVWHLYGATDQPHEAVFELDPPLKVKQGQELVVQLVHQNLMVSGAEPYSFGHFRFSALAEPYPAAQQQLLKLIDYTNAGKKTRQAAMAIIDNQPEQAVELLPSLSSPILTNEQLILKLLVGPEDAQAIWNEFADRYGEQDTLQSTPHQLALAARGSLDGQGQKMAQYYLWNTLYEKNTNQRRKFSLDSLDQGIIEERLRYHSLFGDLQQSVLTLQELVRRDPDNVYHRGKILAYLAMLEDDAEYRRFCLETMEHYLSKLNRREVAYFCRSALLMPEVVSLDELPMDIFEEEETQRLDRLSLGLLQLRQGNLEAALEEVDTFDHAYPSEALAQALAIKSIAHTQLHQFDAASKALLQSEAVLPAGLLKDDTFSTKGQRKLIVRLELTHQLANSAVLLREARQRLGANLVMPPDVVTFNWQLTKPAPVRKIEPIEPSPGDTRPTYEEARQASRDRDWEKASRLFQQLIASEPSNNAYLSLGGLTIQLAGDHEDFANLRSHMISLIHDEMTIGDRERILKTCMATPLADDQKELAETMKKYADETYDKALAAKDPFMQYFIILRGLAAYRSGDYEATKTLLDRFCTTSVDRWSTFDLTAGSLITMSQVQQGNLEQGKRVHQAMSKKVKQFEDNPDYATNIDWLLVQILYRELGEMVDAQP